MKFSLISSKGRRETERRSSALGKGLVACLLLMSVSCMLFVGTTMSWFTDQKTGTAGVITAGEFDVTLHIGSTTAARGTSTNTITMTRVDEESAYWEPGAVFTSPVMYVENTGTLDLEYRLNLQLKEMEEEAGGNSSLLNVIEFRIIDVTTANSLVVDGTVSRDFVDSLFTSDEPDAPIDLRTAVEGAENDTPVAGADGVRTLKAPTESPESPEAPESTKSISYGFIVVGRMKEGAGIECSGLTLEEPFTLVVTAQQSGFNWATLDATQTAP